jgi:hypothetical protein
MEGLRGEVSSARTINRCRLVCLASLLGVTAPTRSRVFEQALQYWIRLPSVALSMNWWPGCYAASVQTVSAGSTDSSSRDPTDGF